MGTEQQPALDRGNRVGDAHQRQGTVTPEGKGSDLDLAASDITAVELRIAGLSYRQIAQQMGVARSTAHEKVRRALARWGSETVEEYRRLELMRLDQATAAVWPQVVSRQPDLRATRTFLQIVDRRARLLGLYQGADAGGLLQIDDPERGEAAEEMDAASGVVQAVQAIAEALGADVAGDVIDVDVLDEKDPS